MRISLATFNVKNLFSRFNFEADLDTLTAPTTNTSGDVQFVVDSGAFYRLRKYKGRLVKGKKAADRAAVAQRIKTIDADVLALQEIEDIDILKTFNHADLGGLYPHHVLVEGNDPRLIDVAVLSKLPLGAVVSWHQWRHPRDATVPVFGRDLLQVEVMNTTRGRVLFTLFNTHLKSHFGDEDNGGQGMIDNNARRRTQAEAVFNIVDDEMRANQRFAIVGDMNDPVTSPELRPFTASSLGLVNALTNPAETRPAKPDGDGSRPASPAWTHRFKRSGQKPDYDLYDQIWLSPSLAGDQSGAFIDRRTKHGGDGSDHDPAWITLDL